ncbi:MAG: site-specific integrase [Candidatus Tectomicrobia bacterium]|nr:site-specific integrase [Candidatus Tectomicrobia bacterium]
MKGDGRTFRRGEIWWVAYYQHGKERRESSKSRKRKDAVRLLRQRVGETAVGTVRQLHAPRRAETRTTAMRDLFDLLENNYRLKNRLSPTNAWSLKRLRRRFADYTVEGCSALAISHYMADMQREGRKPETINREITVLRTAFRLGYRHDLVKRVPPIELLPQLAVRNDFFSREEIDALLPCLPQYLRDAVYFGYLTGWRKGEITGLRWANVDRSAAAIRLKPEQNKARLVRVLVLQGELSALIDRRWQARKDGRTLSEWVFHRSGGPLGDFRRSWATACRQAGIGHRMFHSLRRTAVRNMSLLGIPEKVIMSIVGHKTRAMLDRYNIVTEADQRAYAKRLYGSQGGQ